MNWKPGACFKRFFISDQRASYRLAKFTPANFFRINYPQNHMLSQVFCFLVVWYPYQNIRPSSLRQHCNSSEVKFPDPEYAKSWGIVLPNSFYACEYMARMLMGILNSLHPYSKAYSTGYLRPRIIYCQLFLAPKSQLQDLNHPESPPDRSIR